MTKKYARKRRSEKLFSSIDQSCNCGKVERYGEGNWELAHAYGDHHSDRTILRAARTPHAVDPDRPLLRTARREGWDVLDW